MADSFHLLVVAPGRTVYDGKAVSAIMPAAGGMMGVLPGHAPFFGTLKAGTVSARPGSDTAQSLSVNISGGIAHVLPGEVTIVADSIEEARPQTSG